MAFLAPAGTPVSLVDMAGAMTRALGSHDASAELAASLRRLSGLPNAWPVSSGRAAMTIILKAMRDTSDDPSRAEVVIPAYTCYSVPAAIERAGLRPRLCDVDPATLGMYPEQLRRIAFSRVLAVVSSNLYGLPNDLDALESICREHGVYFLDDAAQALGARLVDRALGAFGDAGLYSFDKGKVISTIQGGAIVCRPGPLAAKLESAAAALADSSVAERLGNTAKLGVYSIFLRPALYPLIRALPFTGLGHTAYETRYPIARLGRFSSAVATSLLERLDELASGRRKVAASLRAALGHEPGLELVRPIAGAESSDIRFPVLVRDSRKRMRLIHALERSGIGATASYPCSLADVPEVRAKVPPADINCPGARKIAESIVTLPTHAYCPPDLPERVLKVIRTCLS